MINQKEKTKRISRTAVLSMGFTAKMIDDLLPEPTLVQNPRYKCAAPMKLWEEKTVLAVMDTDAYKAAKEKSDKRRANARKAVATKAKKTEMMSKKFIDCIRVELLDDSTLVDNTMKSKNEWYRTHDEEREIYRGNVYLDEIDQATKDRWIVNYIRHHLVKSNCSKYDRIIKNFNNQVGRTKAYGEYKKEVLMKISEVYPKYADECKRQIEQAIYYC